MQVHTKIYACSAKISNPLKLTQNNVSFYRNKPQSFGNGIESGFQMSKKLKASLLVQKLLAKAAGQKTNVRYYELSLLEGIQKGIEVFDGLKLKQIAFLADDLHSVINKRGCYSRCSYCYPGADKPVKQTENTINSVLFEDIKSLTDGFKTLRQRTGINFIHNNSPRPYKTLVFDADNIEVAVNDLKGNTHEFPEMNRLIYEATGNKGIFDTSGWNVLSPKYQKRAERIVDYYSNPVNMEELYQFNISINPFHSTLGKVNELKALGKTETAKRIYDKHIEKLANALFTCIPICTSDKFSTIKRAMDRKVPNMYGYYITDEARILNDVYKKLSKMCVNDLKTDKKYIKSKEELRKTLYTYSLKLLDVDIDTELIGAPKLQNLIRSRNPYMGKYHIYNHCREALRNEEDFERMKQYKKYRSANMFYHKIIDINGKVYLSDSYRVIPTDIQLNYINKNKETQPFSTIVKDFVLTEKMI